MSALVSLGQASFVCQPCPSLQEQAGTFNLALDPLGVWDGPVRAGHGKNPD